MRLNALHLYPSSHAKVEERDEPAIKTDPKVLSMPAYFLDRFACDTFLKVLIGEGFGKYNWVFWCFDALDGFAFEKTSQNARSMGDLLSVA